MPAPTPFCVSSTSCPMPSQMDASPARSASACPSPWGSRWVRALSSGCTIITRRSTCRSSSRSAGICVNCWPGNASTWQCSTARPTCATRARKCCSAKISICSGSAAPGSAPAATTMTRSISPRPPHCPSWPGQHSNMRIAIDNACRAAGIRLTTMADVEALRPAAELVARGRACTILPSSVIAGYPDLDLDGRRIVNPTIRRFASLIDAPHHDRSNEANAALRQGIKTLVNSLHAEGKWRGITPYCSPSPSSSSSSSA